jgi:hypothetical protein
VPLMLLPLMLLFDVCFEVLTREREKLPLESDLTRRTATKHIVDGNYMLDTLPVPTSPIPYAAFAATPYQISLTVIYCKWLCSCSQCAEI